MAKRPEARRNGNTPQGLIARCRNPRGLLTVARNPEVGDLGETCVSTRMIIMGTDAIAGYVCLGLSLVLQVIALFCVVRVAVKGGFGAYWWTKSVAAAFAVMVFQRILVLVDAIVASHHISLSIGACYLAVSVLLSLGLWGVHYSMGQIVRMTAAAISRQTQIASAIAAQASDLNHIAEARTSLEDALTRMQVISSQLKEIAASPVPKELSDAANYQP